MARPLKTGLDYFPLDVNIDDNLELIEAEFNLNGFAIVVKLWQKIYSKGYYIDWDKDEVLLFTRRLNTELSLVNAVVNVCLLRSIFDKKLYDKYKILTSNGIQKRYILACSQSKRKNIEFTKEFILVNSEFIELIHTFSTQSKLKEIKTDETNIGFDIFWDLYDKKVGDKNACIRKWEKLKESQKQKIIEILPDFKDQFKDKQFQPHPATFLNGERWNDEIQTIKLNLLQ